MSERSVRFKSHLTMVRSSTVLRLANRNSHVVSFNLIKSIASLFLVAKGLLMSHSSGKYRSDEKSSLRLLQHVKQYEESPVNVEVHEKSENTPLKSDESVPSSSLYTQVVMLIPE
mmetsp:Transcript_18230/g.35814  ORF Transcript_18230/g.35814 Transcript_18230/m.35814 type:complete len:115 (+) Transcript_18230:276-620(+)